MRVLIVNTAELTGGAAVAASRLTDALNRHGVKARMLVRDRQRDSVTTTALPQHLHLRWSFLWERFCIWAANGFRRRGLWAVDIANVGVDVTRLPEFREADIIHLHWVNQGMLSLRQIGRILESGKPVVWTMHDMWPCTGICHHAADCERYHTHCHDCPQLLHPAARDLSWQTFRRKASVYAKGSLSFVAVSQWMAARARASALTREHYISVIPNAMPLEKFCRDDRSAACRALGIPANTSVIAFGAARVDAPGKGFDRLLEVLRRLMDSSSATPHLLLFGRLKDESFLQRIPCPYTYVGEVSSPEALSRIYSAADVLVNASDYETFGQTLAEAMACGCTPVSFDRGGQTDIIHHLEDGYLARFGDLDDLVAGIRWALDAHLPADLLRHSVASRFSEEVVARRHITLYESLITSHHV